jgi:hypothetical protein
MNTGHRGSAHPWPLRDPLFLSGAVLLALVPVLAMLTGLDDRTLYGRSPWQKPLRFAMSLGIYALTVSMAAQWLRARGRVAGWRWLTPLLCGALVFEISWISVQAFRGVDSHFNEHTPLEALMFSLMGVGASLLSLGVLWLGLVAARRVLCWSGGPERLVTLGIALGFIGSGLLLPWTGEALVNVGRSQSAFEAVRMLPLLGWRLDGFDPRPAHFLAAHMMQALPLLALWLARAHPLLKPASAERLLIALTAGTSLLTLGLMP